MGVVVNALLGLPVWPGGILAREEELRPTTNPLVLINE